MDLLLSRFPDETEKKSSRFHREKNAKKADGIVIERSCRFFVLLLYSDELPSKRDIGFCLSAACPEERGERQKNPENPVDPV